MELDERKSRELARWQRRLLPFAIASIGLMAVFFFASSVIQLGRLNENITFKPNVSLVADLKAFERANPDAARDDEHLRWKTLVLLEEQTIERRYAQVNATLMLRAWTRHLGFLTGMILALVGAVFILAKLSESETTLSVDSPGAKGALATSSPGIVLASLGTILMIVTLTVNFEFTTRDVPVYLSATDSADAVIPPPQPLDTPEARQRENRSLFPEDVGNDSSATAH